MIPGTVPPDDLDLLVLEGPEFVPVSRPTRRPAHWTTRLSLAGLLVAGSAAFVPLLLPGTTTEQEDGSGSAAAQVVFVLCYGVLLLAAWLRPTARPRGLLPNPIAYLLVALSAASILWSLSPAISARRAVGLALTVAVAALLPRAMSFLEFLSVLRGTCWLVGLCSLGYALVASTAAADTTSASALRGVFATKNELGRFSAFAAVVFLVSALLTDERVRRGSLVGLALAGCELYMSHSATAVTVTAVVTFFILCLNDVRRRGNQATRWILPTVASLSIALIGAVSLLEVSGVTRILGRDDSFTGRTDLWHLVVEAISQRPWLGYGYQAFWATPGGPADDIRIRLPFPVPHAHNGFLDLWLELGGVAVVLFLVLLVRLLGKALQSARAGAGVGLAASAVVVFMVVSNLTESNLLRANSCYLLVMFALMAYVGEWRSARRRAAP